MGNYIKILGSIVCIILLANWSSPETSVTSHTKHAVNFYGTLTKTNNETFRISNIGIGKGYGTFKEVPFFETATTQATTPGTHRLKKNPRTGIKTKLDLADIREITVPYPDTFWVYQERTKGTRKEEFIEVVVTPQDAEKKNRSYLVEKDRTISCDFEDTIGHTSIPFHALKKLVLEGYCERTAQEQDQEQKPIKSCTKQEAVGPCKHTKKKSKKTKRASKASTKKTTPTSENLVVIDPIT